jgi:hypothetical protein
MERKTVETAVKIIKYAVENNISIPKSCLINGFSDCYVKKIKKRISPNEKDNYKLFYDSFNNYLEKKGLEKQGGTIISTINYPKNSIPSDLINEVGQSINGEQLKFETDDKGAELTWKTGSNYPKGHIKTLDELLKACKVNLAEYYVSNYVVNKWDVTAFKNDVPKTIENFQVKARLEKLTQNIEIKNVTEVFKELIKEYKPPIISSNNFIKSKNITPSENNMLEISIQDLHIGKLSWEGETGENYDAKIASERYISAINMLLKRAEGFEYSEIVFLVGSDFFNSDNLNNTTTHGTPQDEDLRWQKTFKTGVNLVVDGINILRKMNVPINVIVIPGNHDFERSYYMGSFLEAWFNNDLQVKIDNSASPRKYYVFGKVLLGFTHGSEEKMDSLPLLMASDKDSKQYWSATNFHEWHLGHFHHRKDIKYTVLSKSMPVKEDLGVTVKYLSSLTGTEEWHHKKGYIGCMKGADGFIWNDNLGLIAHLTSYIDII